MSTDDRLSALPDSVLARVLSSLHLKAAVQTSLLSKRWRTLWREADGINLDTRQYRYIDYDGAKVGREFFRDALAAIGADGRCPVRRLSVVPTATSRTISCKTSCAPRPGWTPFLRRRRCDAWRSSAWS
jgi:hypothetical protein